MKSIYVDAHPAIKNKAEVIYNGFDDDDFPLATIPREKVIENKVNVFYAGSLYYDSAHRRDVFLLLDSIKVLMEKGLVDLTKIEIKIAAFIPQELLEKLKLHPVFPALNLLGVISRDQVLKEMQLSNLLWHIMFNSYQDRASIPIKTYEYMASRKKVLFFLPQNSELEEIVKEFDLGYIGYSSAEFSEINQKSFLNAYNDVLNNTIQDDALNPRDLSRFKRKYQAGQLAHLIEKLTV